MKKGLKITLGIIGGIIVLSFVLYKPVYNYFAPKVFDYIVEDNLDKLISAEDIEKNIEKNKEQGDKTTEMAKNEETNGKTAENNAGETEKNNEETKSKSKASANSPLNENNDNGVYKSKTSAGVFDENDLASIAKRLTPSDKTQIISIVQSCISAGDYPDLAKRAKNLTHENMAYLESYLRSHMSGSAKQQILNIVSKYK